MTIEKWRDWIELVALIAVVGSLFALVVELRQTQTAMRAQAYQVRAFDLATLTPTERSRVNRLITTVRIDLDNEHFQYQSGFLDPGFYQGETVQRIKGAAPIWRGLGIVSPRPEFKAEVDKILAENQ